MKQKDTRAYKTFSIANYIVLSAIAVVCLLPVIHLLAISLSSSNYAEANLVSIIPKGFSINSYRYILRNEQFIRSAGVSVRRAIIGTLINVIMTLLLAYPLSMNKKKFGGRNIYMGIIVFTMVFSGGLIPVYMLVKSLNLFDTIWALVLPMAVPTFNVVLVMNFMRQLPDELQEAAFVDGASYFVTFWKIVLPTSTPVIATIALFSFVGHWNSWFDGQIFNNDIRNYPLQSYLQVLVAKKVPQGMDDSIIKMGVGQKTLTSAQIFVTMLPMLMIYPFLQRYFIAGIVVGSVKG